MATMNVQSHFLALKEITYLIKGHFFGEDKRDITVVVDRDDVLEIIKSVDASLYETVHIETEGDYFYVSSSFSGLELYIENVKTDNGRIKSHEGDILIVPHYIPQSVRTACVDGSEVVIELALESIYEKLVEIIEG